MDNFCPGFGNSSAKLMIIGEAPGEHEINAQRPFVGPSGDMLNECLEYAGVRRQDVYLTNVIKVRPPGNDIKKLHLIGKNIEEFLPTLWDEIFQINPNCILAVGGVALEALTGKKGIKKYRGSIMTCSKTGHKLVACMHPASLMHGSSTEMTSWKELTFIKEDVKRAAHESTFADVRSPNRLLSVARNSLDVIRFLERHSHLDKVALDVETFRTYPQCVGLAFNSTEAISIPLFLDEIPLHDRSYIWKMIAEFISDEKTKIIAQNAKFDQKRMRQIGLTWRSCWFSMDMGWHVLFPEFPKKLEFITSMITDECYYKDEGRDYNPKIHKIDRWFLYNARDAVVEYECAEKILDELKERGIYEWFFDKIQPLYELYYNIEDTGIKVDLDIRKKLRTRYAELLEKEHDNLVTAIAKSFSEYGVIDKAVYDSYKKFNVMSNGPKNQVAQLLFGYLKLPVRSGTDDETLKSLANNVVKNPHIKEVLFGILKCRKIRKTIGTYLDASVSTQWTFLPKPRIQTTCNINGTESFRTSTGILKPPVSIENEGIALQTMTKHEDAQVTTGQDDLRTMFVADEGFSIVEVDGSQAEDRVVCVLAEDWEELKLYGRKDFRKNKYGIKDDGHTLTAMNVCSLPFEEITDYYRQIGKKTKHAGNYAMGKHVHMLNLAKFGGVFISEYQAGKQLERFHASRPRIKGVFHNEIQEALRNNNRKLTSPHGRSRTFYNRWSEEMFKEAYAYLPQTTVATQTQFAMLHTRRKLSKYYDKFFFFFLESHDSATALVHDSIIDEYCAILSEGFELPISFKQCTLSRNYDLVIPCEIKIGKRWSERTEEYKDGMTKFSLSKEVVI